MQKIFFATTNNEKLKEAQSILRIEIEGVSLEIPEIQSLDPVEVATQKAKAYFLQLKQPIVVEDVGLTFKALDGKLPGAYIKDFLDVLGNEGLIKLLKPEDHRGAVASTAFVYCEGPESCHSFTGAIKGNIADRPLGTNGFGWDQIFIPEGQTKTFGGMDLEEKNKYSMRRIALKKFEVWLKQNSSPLTKSTS